jgi:hypothetical protein
MHKSKLAISVAAFVLGITVASAQRITVNDLGFGSESVQVLSAYLQQGRGDQGVYTGPLFNAAVQIPSKANAPEALLRVYSEGTEAPLFTKLLDKTELLPIAASKDKSSAVQKGTTRSEIYPNPFPDEDYPQWIQYVTKLADDSLPEGMLPGSYKAKLEFYQVTDGTPEGSDWIPWEYGQEGLLAKLAGDSSLPFAIESQEVDIVSYVQATVNISATVVPGRRAKPADVRKLRAAARDQVAQAALAARNALADLGNLRIDEMAPWETVDTSEPLGQKIRLDHYGTISYDKGQEYDNAISTSGTALNGDKTLNYPKGMVVIKVQTESARY